MELTERDAGRRLREVRERLGMKYRDVQDASQAIALARGNQDFALGLSRLADIENRGTVPSIFRLYSLSAVYGLSLKTLLAWYGVDVGKLPADTARINHHRTRLVEVEKLADLGMQAPALSSTPVSPRKTAFLARQASPETGPFPEALTRLHPKSRYALIGTEEWGMYPIIHPGAFVQIDDKRRRPETGPWRSEAERPVYLIEGREGYWCAWCTAQGRDLTLQFHPASGLEPLRLRTPDEAEVVGQVVGVAMRLDWAKRRRTRS